MNIIDEQLDPDTNPKVYMRINNHCDKYNLTILNYDMPFKELFNQVINIIQNNMPNIIDKCKKDHIIFRRFIGENSSLIPLFGFVHI